MAGNLSYVATTQNPVKPFLNVPTGHVVLSSKWRNSDLSIALKGSVNTLYEDNLGYVDFYTASHSGVVYASEADLVSQSGVKRKLAVLRKANKVQVIVLAEKTVSSSQYYQNFQKYVALELGFSIIPIPGQTEAAGILAQMVHTEHRQEGNPFTKKRKSVLNDELLLTTVQKIPKLGYIKARKLLEHFKSLSAINKASVEELSEIVGKASAQNLRRFFDTTPD